MKIKTRYIILSLIGVIHLVVPGMLSAVEPVAVKQPISFYCRLQMMIVIVSTSYFLKKNTE